MGKAEKRRRELEQSKKALLRSLAWVLVCAPEVIEMMRICSPFCDFSGYEDYKKYEIEEIMAKEWGNRITDEVEAKVNQALYELCTIGRIRKKRRHN